MLISHGRTTGTKRHNSNPNFSQPDRFSGGEGREGGEVKEVFSPSTPSTPLSSPEGAIAQLPFKTFRKIFLKV